MFHFTVPSGGIVDQEGVCMAIVERGEDVTHLFDTLTGQVVSVARGRDLIFSSEASKKMEVLGAKRSGEGARGLEKGRYVEIERLPQRALDKHAKQFIVVMKKMMGKSVHARLAACVSKGGCRGLDAYFANATKEEIDGWDDAWRQFLADSVWEDMCAWFSRHPELGIVQVIDEKYKGTCGCGLCGIMERQLSGEDVSLEEMHTEFMVHESMQRLEDELRKSEETERKNKIPEA